MNETEDIREDLGLSIFWRGTLGRTANHAMVIAQLIDGKGTRRGIHNFLVPLRSMTDHQLLKGVTTGDIGPKIGYNNMDNGFASFDNVIIPRRNMAMRFATVDEDGNYSTKVDASGPASKIAYISMMQVRSYIIEGGEAFGYGMYYRYSIFSNTTAGIRHHHHHWSIGRKQEKENGNRKRGRKRRTTGT
jgi:hypothetical protein